MVLFETSLRLLGNLLGDGEGEGIFTGQSANIVAILGNSPFTMTQFVPYFQYCMHKLPLGVHRSLTIMGVEYNNKYLGIMTRLFCAGSIATYPNRYW
jgi:hypothetical protein